MRDIGCRRLIEVAVSMINGVLFDKLDQIGKYIRKNTRPFGGIQVRSPKSATHNKLIVCGDFFQLPPVSKAGDPPARFAFEAECWEKTFPLENMALLTRVFRQADDDFVAVLEDLRKGKVSASGLTMLKSCERAITTQSGIEPVNLYPRKAEVDRLNASRLDVLQSPIQEFVAFDQPGTNTKGYALTQPAATDLLDRNTRWIPDLRLKVGAMVMCVSNIEVS